MRARISTIGLKAGWVVTSFTRSPLIQTWRPSFRLSRYCAPVLSIGGSPRSQRVAGVEIDIRRRQREILFILPSRSDLPMTFTLKQIRYFVAVAETGRITRAGRRRSIPQASGSAGPGQVQDPFEGARFLRPHPQGVRPTPARGR